MEECAGKAGDGAAFLADPLAGDLFCVANAHQLGL
jgi:hypothetical protein